MHGNLQSASWLLLIISLALPATGVRGDTWTDTSGKFSVEATFVGVKDQDVVLQKADGSQIVVPIERLSKASRADAKRLHEQQKKTQLVEQPPMLDGAEADLTTGYPINGTLEQAASFLSTEIRQGNIGVIYLLLPKGLREQADQEAVRQELAVTIKKYDVAARAIETMFSRLEKLFETKKTFIVNSSLKQMMKPDGYNHFLEHYNDVVGFFGSVREMVADRQSIESQTVEAFLQKHGNQIGAHATKFVFNLPDSIPELPLPDQFKITQSEETGELVSERPAATFKWELVDGFWIPSQFAELDRTGGDYSQMVGLLKAFNEKPADLNVIGAIGMVDGFSERMFQPMLAAETQAQFDKAIQEASITLATLSSFASQRPKP